MGAGHARQRAGMIHERGTHRPACGLRGHGEGGNSRRQHAASQFVAGTLDEERGVVSAGAHMTAVLSSSDSDGSPLPLRQRTAAQPDATAKTRQFVSNTGSTTKVYPSADHKTVDTHGAPGDGSPVALRAPLPVNRRRSLEVGIAPPHRMGLSSRHCTASRQGQVIDLTSPRDFNLQGSADRSGQRSCKIAHVPGPGGAHVQNPGGRQHVRGKSEFRAPRRNA